MPVSFSASSLTRFSFFPRASLLAIAAAGLVLLPEQPARAEENLIPNPGFEEDDGSWGIFIPAESENKGCEMLWSKDSPRNGQTCLELKSGDFARFSAGPKRLEGDPIRPGDRIRLVFWVRASEDLAIKGSPAFIVRMAFQDDQRQELPTKEALFIGLNGHTTIQSMEAKLDFSEFPADIPAEWTRVESVFEVPDDLGASKLGQPGFFATYTSGSVYLDDVSLERVGKNVPLSPSSTKL